MTRSDELFGYFVNLDERGSFYADVRGADGETVFEIRADGEEIDLVDAGYMRHKTDVDGLSEHLSSLGIIPAGATILDSARFEAELERIVEDNEPGLEG